MNYDKNVNFKDLCSMIDNNINNINFIYNLDNINSNNLTILNNNFNNY